MAGDFLTGNAPVAPSGGGGTPSSIGWDQVTGKPDFDYVATSRVEQEVTESQVNIPSSNAVAGDFIDLTEAVHVANATNDAKVLANTTEIAANKAGLAANLARIANIPTGTTGTNLTNFDRNLTEFDTSNVLPTYNPNNPVETNINNPLLIAASGFDGIPIGTSNLDKGEDLGTDGTFWHDPSYHIIHAGRINSYVIHNAAGISLTEHDEGIIRVRPGNGDALDTWSVSVDSGRIGTTRTIPAASSTVAAHDALVYHHQGGTEFTFPETEEGAQGDNTESIYALPQDWLDRGTPSLTFSITLYGNNTRIDTETRDSITINDVGQDQEGFNFNMTFLGFPTFVGFFYWKYRASDKSVILEYMPDNNRSVTVSFSANLHYPIPAETTVVPQHLSFVPFTHQPVANDTLIVTLHYVSGTDWQLMATDGDGAVLEQGVYDMGAYGDDDIIYFRDTIEYQSLSFASGAGVDLPLSVITALHNQARVKGYGLFNFTDKTVFGLTADHFIKADAIDGLPRSDVKAVAFPVEVSAVNEAVLYLNSTGKVGGEVVDFSGYAFATLAFELDGSIQLATLRLPYFASKDSAVSIVTADMSVSYTFNFNGGRFMLNAPASFVNHVTFDGTHSNLAGLKFVGFLLNN